MEFNLREPVDLHLLGPAECAREWHRAQLTLEHENERHAARVLEIHTLQNELRSHVIPTDIGLPTVDDVEAEKRAQPPRSNAAKIRAGVMNELAAKTPVTGATQVAQPATQS